MRQQQTLIVKKSAHRGHGEHGGGGAWKVAFADFTMAMMALFLILWLISMTDEQERRLVSASLRNYSIFNATSENPFDLANRPYLIDLQNQPSLIEGIASQLLTERNPEQTHALPQQLIPTVPTSGVLSPINLDAFFEAPFESLDSLSVLGNIISEIGRQLAADDNLAVDIVPQGLRIRLQDNNDRQMFERGGSVMAPFFEDMLLSLAPIFARINNGLMISGHTDAVPYAGKKYSNWELSGDRALMARRVLEAGGTPAGRIVQVTAMAERALAKPEDPTASANRRIEILVLTPKAEEQLRALFDPKADGSALKQARDSAQANQPVTR